MSSIEWPPGFDRTPDAERTANHKYDVSLSQAFGDLETELDRASVVRGLADRSGSDNEA